MSNVKNMTRMFYKATAFNQDISNWNVSELEDMTDMFVITNLNKSSLKKLCSSFISSDVIEVCISLLEFNSRYSFEKDWATRVVNNQS